MTFPGVVFHPVQREPLRSTLSPVFDGVEILRSAWVAIGPFRKDFCPSTGSITDRVVLPSRRQRAHEAPVNTVSIHSRDAD